MKAGNSIRAKYIDGFDNFIIEESKPEAKTGDSLETATRVSKLMANGDGYGIFSPYDPTQDDKTNLQNQNDLEEALLKLKYGYIPFTTGYSYTDGDEKSKVELKLLFVPLITLGELLSLGKQFKQATVISGGIEGVDSYQISDDKSEIHLDQAGIMFAFCSLLMNPGTFK